MTDELSKRYGELLAGAYDCVDRIVLNAYFSLGHNPGGFRVWWRRLHNNSEEDLDNTHLMRMAGRFSRRVRGFAKAHGIPVIDCGRGERKHRIAEEYLATHTVGVGVFLILVARAAATVWEVKRSTQGVIGNIAKKTAYVNHYSFHIMDPDWGHLTVKMSGHPPFGAQVILNGHEWVACQAQTAGIGYTKEGNCFTAVADPQALAQVADARSASGGSTRPVCALAWMPTSRPAAASATPTRSTRSNTAATCCFGPVAGWTACSTRSSTGPAPDWTCRPCGRCLAPGGAPAWAAAPTCHLGWQW